MCKIFITCSILLGMGWLPGHGAEDLELADVLKAIEHYQKAEASREKVIASRGVKISYEYTATCEPGLERLHLTADRATALSVGKAFDVETAKKHHDIIVRGEMGDINFIPTSPGRIMRSIELTAYLLAGGYRVEMRDQDSDPLKGLIEVYDRICYISPGHGPLTVQITPDSARQVPLFLPALTSIPDNPLFGFRQGNELDSGINIGRLLKDGDGKVKVEGSKIEIECMVENHLGVLGKTLQFKLVADLVPGFWPRSVISDHFSSDSSFQNQPYQRVTVEYGNAVSIDNEFQLPSSIEIRTFMTAHAFMTKDEWAAFSKEHPGEGDELLPCYTHKLKLIEGESLAGAFKVPKIHLKSGTLVDDEILDVNYIIDEDILNFVEKLKIERKDAK